MEKGAAVFSDGLASYKKLAQHKHTGKTVGKLPAHVFLPWVHRVFANLKRWLMGTLHGVRKPHLSRYLDEFVFRWNRRRSSPMARASSGSRSMRSAGCMRSALSISSMRSAKRISKPRSASAAASGGSTRRSRPTGGRQLRAPRSPRLARRFDAIFSTETGFVTLDRLLARLRAQKDDLLAVLKHPEIPLHTNGSENDIRCQVTRRKISAGTRSDAGRDARDAFLGLMKTCAKQAVSFWNYLGDRLGVPHAPPVTRLAALIHATATA